MLKDITIGQHFPGHSVLHRCDPRLKLVATIAYIVVLFVAPNPLGLALSIALLAALYKIAQIPGTITTWMGAMAGGRIRPQQESRRTARRKGGAGKTAVILPFNDAL